MPTKADLLQGTLDMLVMRAVTDEPLHGYALVHRLKLISGGRLNVPQGSLYPALHRLELKRWLQAEWRPSDTGREAKFYALTKAGKKQLALEKQSWERLSGAVRLIFEGGE